MVNHPMVECRNQHAGYVFTLKMDTPYRSILERKLEILNGWISQHSLLSATVLINETLKASDWYTGRGVTAKEVDKAIMGEKGMRASYQASLSPEGNRRNPHKGNPLRRKQGSPFYLDSNGQYWIRGEVVCGIIPRRPITNNLSAIRRCVEDNLNLPQYIRHKMGEWDETVCRDENGEPV